GNRTTRERTILEKVAIHPGEVLKAEDLHAAERKLALSGLFEVSPQAGMPPTVSVVDPYSKSEFKDVLITVQEAPTGTMLFGVGINSDVGLSGSVKLNERNFDFDAHLSGS